MPRQVDFRGQPPGVAVDQAGEKISAHALFALVEGDTWIDDHGSTHTVLRRYQGSHGEQVVVSDGPTPPDYDEVQPNQP